MREAGNKSERSNLKSSTKEPLSKEVMEEKEKAAKSNLKSKRNRVHYMAHVRNDLLFLVLTILIRRWIENLS